MKTLLRKLFLAQQDIFNPELVDMEALYLFRVKLLATILLTASVVGLATGLLELFNLLPEDMLYTPIVIVYGLVNFLVLLWLLTHKYTAYTFSMHFAIFSALATFSVMSVSLVYDEFRLIWFFLLSFASFMLGGKWYGITITGFILSIILTQFFTLDLNLSAFALFTFSTSLITFNVFSLIFLNKIEQDALTMQRHISHEADKRRTTEQMLQKVYTDDIISLHEDYFWDTKRKILTHQEQHIALTQKEQLLLSLLLEKSNCCVTFEEIQANVWTENYEEEISTQSVKLQITGLRKKLPKGCIKNVYGCGYIFHL